MVSIIIPTLNEETTIAGLLTNLKFQKGNFEVIIVDGGSHDETISIARSFSKVKILPSAKGRAIQMNNGAKKAIGDILLFLHADTILPPDAILAIENSLVRNCVAGCFYLEFDDPNMLLKIYSLFSRLNHSLFTYGDQAIFIRKSIFEKLGGFANIPIMEDVEIQSRLKTQGKFIKLDKPVQTSARRFLQNGIVKQQLLNMVLVVLFKLGVSPEKIKKYYEG